MTDPAVNQDAAIRIAGAADVPTIAELADRIWRQYYPTIISTAQIDYMLKPFYDPVTLIAEIQDQRIEYNLLLSKDQPIGFSSHGPAGDTKAIKLHKLYLLPAYHGKGYGSLLLRELELRCHRENIQRILLNVNKNNAKAIRSYERNGYQTVDAVLVDIGGGFFMDDYVLEKVLS